MNSRNGSKALLLTILSPLAQLFEIRVAGPHHHLLGAQQTLKSEPGVSLLWEGLYFKLFGVRIWKTGCYPACRYSLVNNFS